QTFAHLQGYFVAPSLSQAIVRQMFAGAQGICRIPIFIKFSGKCFWSIRELGSSRPFWSSQANIHWSTKHQ
ncbi:hypothetical protein ACJMK2_044109, partial [Sinanodonta woodiana]